tara:strand:+ start:110 stop:820 length:711 start_codon:yes stop_codon:yes gene_type:complete
VSQQEEYIVYKKVLEIYFDEESLNSELFPGDLSRINEFLTLKKGDSKVEIIIEKKQLGTKRVIKLNNSVNISDISKPELLNILETLHSKTDVKVRRVPTGEKIINHSIKMNRFETNPYLFRNENVKIETDDSFETYDFKIEKKQIPEIAEVVPVDANKKEQESFSNSKKIEIIKAAEKAEYEIDRKKYCGGGQCGISSLGKIKKHYKTLEEALEKMKYFQYIYECNFSGYHIATNK